MRVHGYVRVSTEEQAGSGLGLEAQRAAIEREVGSRGWTIAAWHEDAGVSARAKVRPALGTALDAMERGDGLVVARLDRLARSIYDFSGLVVRSQREGWKLVCLDPELDFSTPVGRLIANMLASFAEFERDLIAQRVSEALGAKRARGERLGAAPKIAPDVAARILEMREGRTLAQVCDVLNAEQVATPNGGALWRPSSLQRLLGRAAMASRT